MSPDRHTAVALSTTTTLTRMKMPMAGTKNTKNGKQLISKWADTESGLSHAITMATRLSFLPDISQYQS